MKKQNEKAIENNNIKINDIVEANIRFQIIDEDGPYLECIFFDDNQNAHSCKFKEKNLTRIRKKDFLSVIPSKGEIN